MSVYNIYFDETKYMSFLIKDDELLGKYNKILEKVSNSIEKRFDSEPVYNKKYLKSKMKSYKGKINTNSHNDNIPKEGSERIYLSVIVIGSVYRTGKNYHLQVFLEECNCVVKEKNMADYITDIEISSDDSDEENYDEKNFNKENFNVENEL